MSYRSVVMAQSGLSSYWRFDDPQTNVTEPTDYVPTAIWRDHKSTKHLVYTYNNTVADTNEFERPGPLTNDTNTSAYLGGAQAPYCIASSWTTTTVVTAELWFRRSGVPSSEMALIGTRNTSTTKGWEVLLNTSGYLAMWVGDGANTATATGSANLCDNLWHHVVSVRNGNGIYIYVDGSTYYSNASVAASVGSMTGPTYCHFGARWTGSVPSAYYVGYIDEAAVYEATAVSSSDAQAHYAARNDPTVLPTLKVLVDWQGTATPAGGGNWTRTMHDVSSRVMEYRHSRGRSADFSADAQGEAQIRLLNTDGFFSTRRNLCPNGSFEGASVAGWVSDVDAARGMTYGLLGPNTNSTSYWRAWLRFDESSGPPKVRAAFGGVTVSTTGSPTYGVLGALTGDANRAIDLNGSSYVTLTAQAGTYMLANYWSSLYLYLDTLPTAGQYMTIFRSRTTSGQHLYLDSNGILYWRRNDGTGNQAQTSSGLSTGQWYSIATGSTGLYMRIYVNGSNWTSSDVTPPTWGNPSGEVVDIGSATGSQYLDGKVDELLISMTSTIPTSMVTAIHNVRSAAGLCGGTGLPTSASYGEACAASLTSQADGTAPSGERVGEVTTTKTYGGVWCALGEFAISAASGDPIFRAGQPYTLSMSIKSISGSTSVVCGVGSLHYPSDSAVSTGAITTGWTTKTVTWTPTADRDDAVIFVRTASDTSTVFRIDAVQLNAGTSAYTFIEAPTSAELTHGRMVRVYATHDSQDYPLFTGVIERIVPNSTSREPSVTIYARDMLYQMSRKSIFLPKAVRSLREIRRVVLSKFCSDTENMVHNGAFTNNTTGWTGTIRRISDPAPGRATSAEWDASTVYTVTRYSARPIRQGEVVTVSFWAKGLTQSSLIATLMPIDEDQSEVTAYSFSTKARTIKQGPGKMRGWDRYSFRWVCPSVNGIYAFKLTLTDGTQIGMRIGNVGITVGDFEQPFADSTTTTGTGEWADLLEGTFAKPENCSVGANPWLALYENRVWNGNMALGSTTMPMSGYLPGWSGETNPLVGGQELLSGSLATAGGDTTMGWDYADPPPGGTYYAKIVSIPNGYGVWTRLRGNFLKGKTYQFCAYVKAASGTLVWKVYDPDWTTHASDAAAYYGDSTWTLRTWSWTPTRSVRNPILLLKATAASTTVKFSMLRCIEYGSTISYTSPAQHAEDYCSWTYDHDTSVTAIQRKPGFTIGTQVSGNAEYSLPYIFSSGVTYRLRISLWYPSGTGTWTLQFGDITSSDYAQTTGITPNASDTAYTLDWTPSALRERAQVRLVHTATQYAYLYTSGMSIVPQATTYAPWPPCCPFPTSDWELGNQILHASVGLETCFSEFNGSALSILGQVNGSTGSRHYVVPSMTTPYWRYRITTPGDLEATASTPTWMPTPRKPKGVAEWADESDMTGLGEYVVSSEAIANTITVHSGDTYIDEVGIPIPAAMRYASLTVRTDTLPVLSSNDSSMQTHGAFERTISAPLLPGWAETDLSPVPMLGVVESDKITGEGHPIKAMLARHLTKKFSESRARPTWKRTNTFPAQLLRQPDDIVAITNATVGIGGERFTIQQQTLSVMEGGKVWRTEDVLEEHPFGVTRA